MLLHLADEMNIVAENSPEINSLARETRLHISNNENVLFDKARNKKDSDVKEVPGEDIIRNLTQIKSYNDYLGENIDTQVLRIQRLCACCDRSFAFYDAVVETTTDEAVLLTAQKLSSLALDRIGVLKQTLGKECGCTE